MTTFNQKISQDILKLFNEINQTTLNLDTPLDQSGINSMNFVQFIVTVEDQYEIDMEDRYLNIDNFSTLLDVAEVVSTYVAQKRDDSEIWTIKMN